MKTDTFWRITYLQQPIINTPDVRHFKNFPCPRHNITTVETDEISNGKTRVLRVYAIQSDTEDVNISIDGNTGISG